MIGTAPASSKASASARMARSCHRTAGFLAKLVKARPLLGQCAPFISEPPISSISQRFDPAALSNAGVELAQSLFHVTIHPAVNRLVIGSNPTRGARLLNNLAANFSPQAL